MAKVSVYNMKGDEVGNIELNDEIFGADVNEHLIYMAVKQELANTEGQDPFGSFRRRQKALETEGNRSCQTGFDQISSVDGRRRSLRSGSERLFF